MLISNGCIATDFPITKVAVIYAEAIKSILIY